MTKTVVPFPQKGNARDDRREMPKRSDDMLVDHSADPLRPHAPGSYIGGHDHDWQQK